MSSSSFHSAQSFPTHCHCGIPVARLQSWTSKNPGRRFAMCKFRNSEREIRGCGYWEWIDENMVEWQRCLINKLMLEKKLLEKEKEILKAELCNVQDQKNSLVKDLDTIRAKVRHLTTARKSKTKKKQSNSHFTVRYVLLAALLVATALVWAVVGM